MIKHWTVRQYKDGMTYTDHHIKGAKFGDMDMEAFYKYLALAKKCGELNFMLSNMNLPNYTDVKLESDYIKRKQLVALLDSYGAKGSSLIRNYRNERVIVH